MVSCDDTVVHARHGVQSLSSDHYDPGVSDVSSKALPSVNQGKGKGHSMASSSKVISDLTKEALSIKALSDGIIGTYEKDCCSTQGASSTNTDGLSTLITNDLEGPP